MEDYKPNTQKYRDAQAKKESEPEKKVEKVVKGTVATRKKSPGKKFMENFLAEDLENVRDYIIHDVLIPGAKDAFLDAMSMLLNGDTRRRKSSSGGRTNYGSMFSANVRQASREGLGGRSSSNNRSECDYDDIIFESRADAEIVLDQLIDLIDQYKVASVSDYYDLVGKPDEYTYRDYGWTNLASASVERIHEGYHIKLPKAKPID